MKKTKKWWLSAATALTLVLGIGYIAVNASENKADAEKVKSEIKTEALAPIYKWYELISTSNTSASSQQLLTGSPMSAPPAHTDAGDCAREENNGDYCAVAVEFAPGTTNFTLSGTDLQNAINNNSNAVGIASSTPAVDEDGDGYSRKPEL